MRIEGRVRGWKFTAVRHEEESVRGILVTRCRSWNE
jgi:hypothetical protein